MAEEYGVGEVNGKTEELAIENGECDEEEKGSYLLIYNGSTSSVVFQEEYFINIRRHPVIYISHDHDDHHIASLMRYDDNKVF